MFIQSILGKIVLLKKIAFGIICVKPSKLSIHCTNNGKFFTSTLVGKIIIFHCEYQSPTKAIFFNPLNLNFWNINYAENLKSLNMVDCTLSHLHLTKPISLYYFSTTEINHCPASKSHHEVFLRLKILMHHAILKS